MRENRKKTIKLTILSLILLLGIGFAALAANLKIDGTLNVSRTSWDVHFENVAITEGSVTANPAPTSNNTDTTEMTYTINFTKPGDYFEFTTDIVNEGTIDAMVDVVSNNAYANASSTTPITLPTYLTSTVTYDDGVPIAQNQELLHNTSEKIKVRVEFKKDIEISDLPSSGDTSIVFKFIGDYKQKDESSKPVRVDFSTASWDDVIDAYENNPTSLEQSMNNGVTKEVKMDIDNDGTDETYHVRIANLSKCTTEGTGSSCGLVIEFADVVALHRYNPYSTDGTTIGDGNNGGWEHSELREYISTTIYNALPSDIKSIIISTTVVSGHGDRETTNFETSDKLFLLDAREVYGDNYDNSRYNTAHDLERQLDYYRNKGVTDTSFEATKKAYKNTGDQTWWLRSAGSWFHHFFFFSQPQAGCGTKDSENPSVGVSPAFRIA